MIRCFDDSRGEKAVFARFKEAHLCANGVVHTPIFKVIEQAVVKDFLAAGTDVLLDDKMYKLTEFKDFSQTRTRYMTRLSNLLESMTIFVKQQLEEPLLVKQGLQNK